MENKHKFIMLMGIPASGKSALAKELAQKEGAVLLSSDNIREELFGDATNQDNNIQVFETMKKRTIEALKSGQSVVYDSTNTSRRRRKAFLNELKKIDVEKIIYFLPIYHLDAINRNYLRDRKVSIDVIDRAYKHLQIPLTSEGWDEIKIIPQSITVKYSRLYKEDIKHVVMNNSKEDIMLFLGQQIKWFCDIYDMPQDSSYHSFSVSLHTYHVYEYILNNCSEWNTEVLLWAGLLHDVGKVHCKSFYNYKGEKQRYANFRNHENCSAQIAYIVLSELGYDTEFIHEVATLCQFHMALLNNEKPEKLIDKVGKEMYNKLVFLREADKNAH